MFKDALSWLKGNAIVGVAIAFSIYLANLFIKQYGILLIYLKTGSFILLFLSIWIAAKYSKKIAETVKSKFPRVNSFTWIFQVAIFLCSFYLLQSISDSLLRSFSDKPSYVLFPCAFPPESGEQERLAKEFWRLGPIDRFSCGF